MATTITALLVDDEENSRVVLRNLLKDSFAEVEVVGEAANVDEAYELVNSKRPQLVFLDIQMPRASGFTLLKKFPELPFEVIFVTSYDKYAINAIKFSALDYLLKPIEVAELQEAVKKAVKGITLKTNKGVQIINLLQSFGEAGKDKKIVVHSGENVLLLGGNQIAYFESDGSYCNITTNNNETYTTTKYVKDFEDYFGDKSDFVRTHKNSLINIKYIKKYSKGEHCIVEMVNGKIFEVSRRKKQEVLERLKGR